MWSADGGGAATTGIAAIITSLGVLISSVAGLVAVWRRSADKKADALPADPLDELWVDALAKVLEEKLRDNKEEGGQK